MPGEGWEEPWQFPLPWPPLGSDEVGVTLRPWGAGEHDADALAEAWADPEVVRWTAVPADASVAAARRWIQGEERRRAEGVAMDLVISELGSPRQIHGEVGLAMVDPERRWAELGYWLAPGSRGAGRAAVAVRLFADWVLRELPVARLIARTQPDNEVAGRVAEAARLERAGALDTGTVVWVRDRA
jgi:RimJ/RimL family protein N-acetyltransferase